MKEIVITSGDEMPCDCNNKKVAKETLYWWGIYKNLGLDRFELLLKLDNEYYLFARDYPLSEKELNRFSELLPAIIKTPEGKTYGGNL